MGVGATIPIHTGRRATRIGRVALLPLFWIVVAIGLLGWIRTPAARRPQATGPGAELWVDPGALAGGVTLEGVDPRWGDELAERLASHPPFRAVDEVALEELRSDLESLSFVARATVHGPSAEEGLTLDLVLREPAACVPVGSGFQTVDAEGVLLSGLWPTPTRVTGGALPVLGPIRDGDTLFRAARPGDWLAEPEHLDALAVALSLRAHLAGDERRALDRVVIDARSARRASVEEPGVRLALEGRRLVLFGRAPTTDEPGELPVEDKWRSVRAALALLADGVHDWELVDVRWDRPELALRRPVIAQAAPTTAAPRAGAYVAARPGSGAGERPGVR